MVTYEVHSQRHGASWELVNEYDSLGPADTKARSMYESGAYEATRVVRVTAGPTQPGGQQK